MIKSSSKRERVLVDSLSDRIIGLCNRDECAGKQRPPGGAVWQPHIGRDHQQHHGPGSARDTELEESPAGPDISNRMDGRSVL